MGAVRITRVSLGAVLLGGALAVMAPHAGYHVSRNAVVNAPVMTLSAPFDGVFRSDPLLPAMAIRGGDGVFRLDAGPSARLERARIVSDIARLSGEIDAVDAELAALEALDRDLAARDAETREFAHGSLSLRLNAVSGSVAAAQARVAHLAAEADRQARLADAGTVPPARVETADLRVREARAELERVTAERRRLQRQLSALGRGIMPASGAAGGDYARERRDELALRRAGLAARRDTLVAARDAARSLLAALAATGADVDRFAPALDEAAVVWSASPGRGTAVAAGEEIVQLLDCSRRFVEVPMGERAFGAIAVGDEAEVRLKGSDRAFRARVVALRGAGSLTLRTRLAAAPLDVAPGDLSVLLALPPVDPFSEDTAERFCDVGRSAEVRLPRALPAPVAALDARLRDAARRLRSDMHAAGRWVARRLGDAADDA
jgi:multidrug resistance efflux pump